MATTYTSAKVAAGVQAREVHAAMQKVAATYTITAAFVINDVVQMVKVPKGAKITRVSATVPALDSSTGVVWSVGDGGDAARYITGATGGRSGAAGFQAMNATAGLGYVYTVDDTIDFKVTTAATGTAATTGDIVVVVEYDLN